MLKSNNTHLATHSAIASGVASRAPARRSLLGMLAVSILATGALAACAPSYDMVTGTASYRENVILPSDSRMVVRLVDATRPGPYVVAEETVLPAGQVPVRFAVRYDYRNINPNGTYYLTAQIEQGGRVLFTNDQNYAVLTRNSPKQNVAINLVPTNAAMLVPAPGVVVQPGVTVIQPAPMPPTAVVVPPAGTVIVSPR